MQIHIIIISSSSWNKEDGNAYRNDLFYMNDA